MKITETKIKINDLIENYNEDSVRGAFGYNNKLTIRPEYQREFVYNAEQQESVIRTVMMNCPLSNIYWAKTGDDTYEIMDGQQRTISICRYAMGGFNVTFNGNKRFFHNFTKEEREQFYNYELSVYICEGTEREKLDWFRVINIAGEMLTDQELLNAVYHGPFVTASRRFFSVSGIGANDSTFDGYIKGSPIRQEIFEKVLKWAASKDNKTIEGYLAQHQHDKDSAQLESYYRTVMNWAKTNFPITRKGITDSQDWGLLYNKYKDVEYNFNDLEEDIKKLILDDDVTKQSGIVPYLLSGKTEPKFLNIRSFSKNDLRKKYEEQEHKCCKCGNEFKLEDMDGDHITPWTEGGHTVYSNLQMLCKKCNREKGSK